MGGLSFVGAGVSNAVASNYAGIVSGTSNSVAADNSFIGSGQGNVISNNGSIGGASGAEFATIVGGLNNTIKPQIANGARYGVIGGGHGNTLSAFNGVIAGGLYNVASGDYSVVPGGQSNDAAGTDSFAAGNGSQASTNGAFVWSDDSVPAKRLKSSAANQFLARAAGGFYLYSSTALISGVKLAPGSGSWSSLSDRAAKTAVASVDDQRILAKLASLAVTEWSYTAQGTGVRHLGPLAQDFHAAFGLGEDDRHISVVDEEGIARGASTASRRSSERSSDRGTSGCASCGRSEVR